MSVVRVIEPGALTLVHDLGRPGLARWGLSASGAFDRAAHRLANRLVGNPDTAAALECLLGGLRLGLPAGTWFAVTGARGETALLGADGRRLRVEPHTAVLVEADAELQLGPVTHGLRTTVALRGGIEVDPVLGSRSRDTLAALGPEPLRAGDELPIGPAPATPVPAADLVPIDAPADGVVELGVRPGPRLDWFTDDAWRVLLSSEWVTSARSDRTGVRLEGAALERRAHLAGVELASEGMLWGSIQVSPDGAPTVLGPDHPVTGGYPVIAVVVDGSLDLLAQLRPGQRVRVRLATGRY
ncbi:MAG: biotin-dependent carboxyltransferase family protein [Microcella sp.]|uniref:5-oxoprolinase subunit C family protein n=1 Tax=Microcella sp. TaxID=1913979 RepID=UPI0024C5D3E2|nr:biotin-dependent carboxyltransferase family protein [Microcella sp.]UYN83403.1 MAG: biotin-dependent carboxyltransferase family protein [Microcella sp.]